MGNLFVDLRSRLGSDEEAVGGFRRAVKDGTEELKRKSFWLRLSSVIWQL